MAINLYTGFTPIPPIKEKQQEIRNNPDSLTKEGSLSFESILKSKTEDAGKLKFSRHANERMQQRNIGLTPEQRLRLESGIQRAGQKGIRESLVMVDDMAFIVNVSNNTVITAVSENDDRIFTNIDGAVIV